MSGSDAKGVVSWFVSVWVGGEPRVGCCRGRLVAGLCRSWGVCGVTVRLNSAWNSESRSCEPEFIIKEETTCCVCQLNTKPLACLLSSFIF